MNGYVVRIRDGAVINECGRKNGMATFQDPLYPSGHCDDGFGVNWGNMTLYPASEGAVWEPRFISTVCETLVPNADVNVFAEDNTTVSVTDVTTNLVSRKRQGRR